MEEEPEDIIVDPDAEQLETPSVFECADLIDEEDSILEVDCGVAADESNGKE